MVMEAKMQSMCDQPYPDAAPVKTFKLSYEYWCTFVVEVRQDSDTIDYMECQLLFWTGGQDMIDDQDGDIQKAYLKMLGKELVTLSIENWNTLGLIGEIEETEGWGMLDGSQGVKLIKSSNWEFSLEDICVSEVK